MARYVGLRLAAGRQVHATRLLRSVGVAVFGGICLGIFVGGGVLSVETAGWIFMEKFSGDVGPELVEERPDAALRSYDEPVLEGETNAGLAGLGVVEIGEGARDDVAANVGVIRLEFAGFVALAHEVGGYRVEKPMTRGAVAQPEIARILAEERWQQAVADHSAVKRVEISRSGSLEVALWSPGEPGIVVQALVEASHQESRGKGEGVGCGMEGKVDLLAGSHGDGVVTVRDVKGRNNASDALVLLLLDLLGGFLLLRLLSAGWLLR